MQYTKETLSGKMTMSEISEDLQSLWVSCIIGKLDPNVLKTMKPKLALKDAWGSSAAVRAAVWGRINVLTQLVSSGVKLVDDVDLYGNTLLHHAASHAQTETCVYLLEQGLKPDALNSLGETPLAISTNLPSTRYSRAETVLALSTSPKSRKAKT